MCGRFIDLHTHSTFSFLDGYGTTEQIADRIVELGRDTYAITDHGVLFGHVPSARSARKRGLKVIYGVEAYVVDDISERTRFQTTLGANAFAHVTILAKNAKGYENLLRLNRKAWEEGFYYKPRVDWETIFRHQEGLIVLSGCVGGYPSRLINSKGPEASWEFVSNLAKNIEHYYVEIVPEPGYEPSYEAFHQLGKIAADLNLPYVFTSDAHFPRPEDHAAEDILLAVGTSQLVDAPDRKVKLPAYQYYCSEDELVGRIREIAKTSVDNFKICTAEFIQRGLEESRLIADSCDVELPKAKPVTYYNLGLESAKDMLWRMVGEGAVWRKSQGKIPVELEKTYYDRAVYEYKTIERKGFCDYLLAISDVVKWARGEDAMVVLRGSATGCLMLWLLGASEVDPIKHDLSFERFYDDNRPDPPDVDIDFEQSIRDRAIDYVYSKYGLENCSQIAALSQLKAKAALQDACKAYGISRAEFTPLANALHSEDGDMDRQLEEVTDPAALAVLEKYPQLRIISKMVGQYRQSSVHAAGVLVASQPLDTCVAVVMDSKKRPIAAVDKYGAAELGLLKMDFLAVRGLDVVGRAARMIKGSTEWIYDLPLDDPETLANANHGLLGGVFQLDGMSAARVSKEIGLHQFEDLVAASALCRPGPGDWVPVYYENKTRPDTFSDYLSGMHPIAAEIVKKTFGILLYQEQVMRLAKELAMFDWPDVHKLRKGVTGKAMLDPQKGPAWAKEWSTKFIGGCVANGVAVDEAQFWWRSIQSHGAYSFNLCLSGDTVVMRGAAGPSGGNGITLRDLYLAQESRCINKNKKSGTATKRTPIAQKMRAGNLTLLQMDTDNRIRPARMKAVYYQGQCDTLLVTTEAGRTIRCTRNHRLLTDQGYKQAAELVSGDRLLAMGEVEAKPVRGHRSTAAGNHYEGKGFKIGESNPAYIDGRKRRFESTCQLVRARAGDKCETCFAPNNGNQHNLEFAHLAPLADFGENYDLYHSAENIKLLCNSCHKTLDYVNGTRKKRWSKGRPIVTDKIVTIGPGGVTDVYDVEMNTEQHNFIANGIVSHNSHCVSYGYVGYWMLWLKTHYPAQFYTAYLQVEDQPLKMKRLIAEFQAMGGRVELFDTKNPSLSFKAVDEKTLAGGLIDLKGIGVKTVEKALGQAPFISQDGLIEALGRANAKRIHATGVLTGNWDPQGTIMLAPWFPVQATGAEEARIRDQYKLPRINSLVWGVKNDGDTAVSGYITVKAIDGDRIIFNLEDETGSITARVPYKQVASLGPKCKALEVADYVVMNGWWAGEVLFIKDVVLIKRWKPAEKNLPKPKRVKKEAVHV